MSAKKRLFGLEPSHAVALLGVVAAFIVAALVNVLAARRFTRWDWTTGKRYTLSAATLTTLHDLSAPVDVWVLMGSADPLEQSVKQLLVAYQAETPRLDIHYVDPDRDTLELISVHKRFGIQAGVMKDGQVLTDTLMIVARGERHWFLRASDMVEVASEEDARVRPREEQAITKAIRQVVREGDKPRICFTAGHEELSVAEGGLLGLSFFQDILLKDNYEVDTVDTTDPSAREPFKGCAVVVIAGPRGDFSKDESARLKTYLLEGGNLFAAVSPINARNETGLRPLGIDDALAPFGIGMDEDMISEMDPSLALPEPGNIRFYVTVKPHPVTAALVRSDEVRAPPRVSVHFARSLKHVAPPGSTPAVDLLVSSDKSFGRTSLPSEKDAKEIPSPKDTDPKGPLVVAMASERPKVDKNAPHGPRVVVVGTASVMVRQNWDEPLPLRGAVYFVESAISWLASKPEILDVPERPAVSAGIRITQEARAEVVRYVLVFMPLAAMLLGVAVAMRRRSTEGAPRGKAKP